MSSIEQLQPAPKESVALYLPYYTRDKHGVLPYAISLYQQGFLEGERQIEGSEPIPFVATWLVSKLPAELTRCRLQFGGQADLSYELTQGNSEFIGALIEVINGFKQNRATDFPNGFYRKLLRFDQ
jgi:hypothetical protein